ncbi:nucleoside triphosphate pyrophosphohydrolase family protein [Paenibacillus sp. CAU 1782]
MESTNAPTLEQFQQQVSELLLRHRSLLDVMSKLGQSGASVNRAVSKAVTDCGCIELNARKQHYSDKPDLENAKETLQSHLSGSLCENCNEVLRSELGRNLFYMTALCNLLHINLDEVVAEEYDKCSTLGLFNLT